MSDAVYVRFDDSTLKFINKLSKEEETNRSETIKRLVNYATKRIRIERAVKDYKEGKCSIREGAESAKLRYFEFFDLLAKENIIGTSPENTELMIKQLMASRNKKG